MTSENGPDLGLGIINTELNQISTNQSEPNLSAITSQEMLGLSEEQQREKILTFLQDEGLPFLKLDKFYPVVDVSGYTTQEIITFINTIKQTVPVVFHGGKSVEPHDVLDPSISKLSGKPQSVYASDDARVALMNAVINKLPSIREKDFGVGFSSSMNITERGNLIFECPPAMYDALSNLEASEVATDGFVYVLSQPDFELSTSGHASGLSDHEFNAQQEVMPLVALKVPASVAQDIIVIGQGANDTIVEYSQEQMARYKRRNRVDPMFEKIRELLPEDRLYTGVETAAALASLENYQEMLQDPAKRIAIDYLAKVEEPMTREKLAELLVDTHVQAQR